MPETAVLWAAYGSTFAIMSFFTHLFVKRDEASHRYILRGDYHYTSNFKAAIAVTINVVIGITVEETVIQPYLISLYTANIVKIIQLLFASGIAFFLTIWWQTGITKNAKRVAAFVLGCVISAFLLLDGFGIIFEQDTADAS